MAKRQQKGVLSRLAGKRLVFSGKFSYGVEAAIKAIADAQQGKVCDDLNGKVDYLVLADLNAGKTIQKKALSLNSKGASIQVIDVEDFRKLAEPTEDEVLALLRAGDSENLSRVYGPGWHYAFHTYQAQSPMFNFRSENLDGIKLKNIGLEHIRFEGCSFVGAEFEQVHFGATVDCDFSKASGEDNHFADVQGSRFVKAKFHLIRFEGDISRANFSGAELEQASFEDWHSSGTGPPARTAPVFAKARLTAASFPSLQLKSPDFGGADLGGSTFTDCTIDAGTFTNAKLGDASLAGCKVFRSDFSKAELSGANFANATVTDTKFSGANVKNANFRGATLGGVDLTQARNYDPSAAIAGSAGPALMELDKVFKKAKRINLTFRVCAAGEDGEEVGIDSTGLRYGWGVRLPSGTARRPFRAAKGQSFSDAMLEAANLLGHLQVRFETVEVSSTKSPKGGKELRELMLQGIAEAFAQSMPPEEELAAATQKYREAERAKGAADRKQREEAKAQVLKQKEKAKKQIAKKIEKAVGKVSDVASFLQALELRIEKPKIDKATKMLKASGFKLFNDITDEHVSGVVKSQTDPDLVYACRVASDGQYACCTQNLNVCGGLRGSICKHQLVLIIGLVQAGELDPTTIDEWVAKTHSVKPELDKETMGAIFIKYKGAEAGEVDWRPTETVPEDYYAL